MALENILNELGVIGRDQKINLKYNPKALTSTNEYIGKLEEINTRTEEGLGNYEKLTGYSAKGVAPEEAVLDYKKTHACLVDVLGRYATEHFKSVTKEIEDDTKLLNIAYSSCPKTESKSEKYNAVRNIAYTARETIKQIQEKPGEYIKKQIDEAPDFMKTIIARFAKEVLEIDARGAQRKAFSVIHGHGSAKFVTEMHGHLKSLETEYIKDTRALDEREKKMEKENPYLDAKESVKYFAEIEKGRAELKEREKQLEVLPQLTNAIVQNAIGAIQEREEKGQVIEFPTREDFGQEEYDMAA